MLEGVPFLDHESKFFDDKMEETELHHEIFNGNLAKIAHENVQKEGTRRNSDKHGKDYYASSNVP